MKIIAHGHYSAEVEASAPLLKDLVKETTGEHVRRIGRFIQLALIGSSRCVQQLKLPTNTGVYLTSGRGDLEITLEVLTQMVEHNQPPKPLNFINTVSNSACYYVSKHFGLNGRSNFVTRRHAPVECALQLAALDIKQGLVQTALVGCVDIVTEPLSHHRTRLGFAADTAVGEGSHWFLLANDDYATPAIATIQAIKNFPDKAALDQWLLSNALNNQSAITKYGQHINAQETLPYWYDSHCGSAIGVYLDQSIEDFLHIDTDPSGRFNLIYLTKP